MRAPVGEKATNDGPVPAGRDAPRALAAPVLITIALRERRPGPTTTRWPLGDTRDARHRAPDPDHAREREPHRVDDRTERPPALVTYTRAPEVSTATENGLRPTRIVFTVRSPTRSTSASLRVPQTT